MSSKKKVATITEASEEISSPLPGVVVLSNKQEYTITRMRWTAFEEIWGELSSVLSAFLGENAKDEGGIIGQIAKAPGLVVKLIALSSVLTESDVKEMEDYADVLKLGRMALKVNFKDVTELMDFFSDAMGALGVGVKVPAE